MLIFSFYIIYLILNAACDAYHNNIHQIMYKLANILTVKVFIIIVIIIIIILREKQRKMPLLSAASRRQQEDDECKMEIIRVTLHCLVLLDGIQLTLHLKRDIVVVSAIFIIIIIVIINKAAFFRGIEGRL